MHIPDDPLYHEKFYFTPGDLGFPVWKTRYGRIGVLVCWDQWYPEAARLTALGGAQILFYPTAIGWHPSEKQQYGASQHSAWQTIQRSHAIANGVFVAAVNRVGHEGARPGGIEFWGRSFVCDPSGNLVSEVPRSGGTSVAGDLDNFNLVRIPASRDRKLKPTRTSTRGSWLESLPRTWLSVASKVNLTRLPGCCTRESYGKVRFIPAPAEIVRVLSPHERWCQCARFGHGGNARDLRWNGGEQIRFFTSYNAPGATIRPRSLCATGGKQNPP
jgi:hypothetical protein